MAEDTSTGRGVACAPDAVWARVREDYLAGRSATECCRRHGVGLTSLRNRAAREAAKNGVDELGTFRAPRPLVGLVAFVALDQAIEVNRASHRRELRLDHSL